MDKQCEQEVEKLAQVVIEARLTPPNDGKIGEASSMPLDLERCCKGFEREFGLRLEARLEELLGQRLYVFDQELVAPRSIRIERLPDLS